ncbi:hypothetical protein SB49_02525 [Sediminicola sp. YIK13]|uniref:hypothetical protein n=1 Tax=Sediminicola sp. YIK13 TaxID=1453352 RepID=UPI000721AC50|nr:hypothetical protein [Sediminicola sp. YIK13]ALM06801.1 hypothetical protein SB49_02525 [Sediminicola sp. YIK13]
MDIVESKKISTSRRFWNVIKNGLFFHGLRNRLERIGINIMPYYWVEEEVLKCEEPQIKGNVADYKLRNLNLEELALICKDIDNFILDDLYEDFKNCDICIGLENNKEIAAYMFIGLNDFNFKHRKLQILENEAYLFNMWTFHSFRGRNLAPYLRYKSYELLNEMGRDTKYSITEYFNKSSIKFKNKLNSKHLQLYLYIELFGTVKKHFLIKSYS